MNYPEGSIKAKAPRMAAAIEAAVARRPEEEEKEEREAYGRLLHWFVGTAVNLEMVVIKGLGGAPPAVRAHTLQTLADALRMAALGACLDWEEARACLLLARSDLGLEES
jgi:hypothetical protein